MHSRKQFISEWAFSSYRLTFTVLLPHAADAFLSEYSIRIADSITTHQASPWAMVTSSGHPGMTLYLYRRRALLDINLSGLHFSDLDSAIRYSVDSDLRRRVVAFIRDIIEPCPNSEAMRMMPILISDFVTRPGRTADWIGDGATSFHFRMYDASRGHQALVRVSRHIIVVAGAGGRLVQEVVNLVYEKILYKSPKSVSDESVFAFLDGLARYTVPTENSIFLQREFARLGVFLASVQVLVGVWGVLAGGKATEFLVLSLSALLLLVVISYFSIRRLHLVEWH